MKPLRTLAALCTVLFLYAQSMHAQNGQFEKFVVQLEEALNGADTAFLDSRVRIEFPALEDSGKSTFMPAMGTVILREGIQDGSYRFIRWIANAERTRDALFRVAGTQTLSYAVATITDSNDSVCILDWRNLTTGVSLRSLLAIMSLPLKAARDAAPESIPPPLKPLLSLLQQVSSGLPREAHMTYMRLDEHVALMPVAVAARVKATQLPGALTSETAWFFTWLSTGKKRTDAFPLLLFEWFVSRGDYRSARRCIRSIERFIGTDPGTVYLRALLYTASGAHDKAFAAYADIIETDPDFETPYLRVLDLLITRRKFADAALTLDALVVRFGYEFDIDKMTEITGYEPFIRSKEFRKWAETVEDRSAQ